MRDGEAFDGERGAISAWIAIGALCLASLHQMYVGQWLPIAGHHTAHALLYASSTIAVVVIIVTDARRTRESRLELEAT
jgi:hypothetical protein